MSENSCNVKAVMIAVLGMSSATIGIRLYALTKLISEKTNVPFNVAVMSWMCGKG